MIAEALIAGLAGWRLAYLLVRDDGPFGLFERIRAKAGVPRIGFQAPRPFFGGVLSCMYCATVWTAGAAWTVGHFGSWLFVVPVAAMGAAAMLEQGLIRWPARVP